MRPSLIGCALLAPAFLLACAGPSLLGDGTSVSVGRSNGGRLRNPARLPDHGRGFVVPDRWRERGFQFGVEELVRAVQRAARLVRVADRRATLGVADLSRDRGGSSVWHNSHESGRDVDLLFYTTDLGGEPLQPPAHDMISFAADGRPYVRSDKAKQGGYQGSDWNQRRFDTARNWALIEALLTDSDIRVQWIFVSRGLEDRLLAFAEARDRPVWIREYARTVMWQPADSLPHDDHFHVRIYCARTDRFHGCTDRGVVWQHEKKAWKYGGPERYDPVTWRLALSLRAAR